MTGKGPADRLVTTTPVTVSSAPSAVPTARGITSHDGAAACPQPNHTNAKNPSTTTVTPRLPPAGNSRDVLSTGSSSQSSGNVVDAAGRGGAGREPATRVAGERSRWPVHDHRTLTSRYANEADGGVQRRGHRDPHHRHGA